jgi:hypothetical protein
MTTLKPCPFCGCRFRIERRERLCEPKAGIYRAYHVGYGDEYPFDCPANGWERWDVDRKSLEFSINQRRRK